MLNKRASIVIHEEAVKERLELLPFNAIWEAIDHLSDVLEKHGFNCRQGGARIVEL